MVDISISGSPRSFTRRRVTDAGKPSLEMVTAGVLIALPWCALLASHMHPPRWILWALVLPFWIGLAVICARALWRAPS